MDRFAFIGVPIDSVGRRGGTERGPEAVRALGLPAAIGADDRGDLELRIRGDDRDPETGIVASADVLATTTAIRDAVAETIVRGARPFLAGGCCAELPGALAGARDALGEVGLAHVDGHLDLYDGTTSPTGEAADMPISVVLGHGPRRWVEAIDGPVVSAERLALIGYRDKAESIEYGMLQPEHLSPQPRLLPIEVVRAGAAASGERAASSLGERGRFWLHLDVDVLDQEVFPATDYLMPGGMSWEELRAVLEPLAASPALAGVSLACYNPEKDPEGPYGRALVEELGLFQ